MLLLLPTGCLTMDLNHEGREIILQTDIDTVLITTDLSQVRGALFNMTTGLKTVKQNMVADVRNALVKDQRTINKALLDALRANERSVNFLQRQLDSVESKKGSDKKQKRAFELLGSFLSTVTGVPSARDHRKILEQVKSIRLENVGLEKLMTQQSKTNRMILETMHLHDSEIGKLESTMNSLVNDTRNLISHIHKSFALSSINSKLMNAFMAATFTITGAKAILEKGDEGLLCREAISLQDLNKIIDNIHIKRSTDSPVFSRETSHNYYQLKLAHA